MPLVTLRRRFFPLHQPEDVDRFLDAHRWCVVFKAGTSDKTFDAWLVAQRLLEPRVDVAVGFVRLPEDRAASDRTTVRSGVPHRSPQFILFEDGAVLGHLDEFAIVPDQLSPFLARHLPAAQGPPVVNEAAVSLEPYQNLLARFVSGALPDERFQWAYLDRLEKEASWRDDAAFDLLNRLFENPFGRDFRAARLIAIEFQGQLAGGREPLKLRAERLLKELAVASGDGSTPASPDRLG